MAGWMNHAPEDLICAARDGGEPAFGRPAFPAEKPATLLWQIAHENPPAPRSVDPQLHPDFENVLLKALARDSRDRYATAAEFADDLERFVSDKSVLARRPASTRRRGSRFGCATPGRPGREAG